MLCLTFKDMRWVGLQAYHARLCLALSFSLVNSTNLIKGMSNRDEREGFFLLLYFYFFSLFIYLFAVIQILLAKGMNGFLLVGFVCNSPIFSPLLFVIISPLLLFLLLFSSAIPSPSLIYNPPISSFFEIFCNWHSHLGSAGPLLPQERKEQSISAYWARWEVSVVNSACHRHICGMLSFFSLPPSLLSSAPSEFVDSNDQILTCRDILHRGALLSLS